MLKNIDKWGGPETFPHMAAGWAVAGNTPFMWTKQVASNFGGTRNPLVVSWPARIKAKGEIRSQFQHVVDIAPTVLEAAGMPEPKTVNGVAQTPMEGVSMVYTFDDAKAAGRHKTQYFEIFGNRAIYHDGWVAATVHKAPWEATPRRKLAEDVWELYNVDEDFSETNDLAASNPAKLKELQALFMKEAERYRVLPIDDRVDRTVRPRHGGPSGSDGRPQVAHGLRGHDRHDGERVHQREEPVGDDHRRRGDSRRRRQRRDPRPGRPLRRLEPLRQGRQAGLHLQLRGPAASTRSTPASGSRPARRRSSSTSPTTATAAARAAPPRISINGKKVGSGRVEHTNANIFSADDAADVGVDEGTNVSSAYPQHGNKFTGKIEKVKVDVR